MSTSRAIGAVAGYAAMALAIAVGVEGFVVADVQLALVRIDADDSATWPNMAPSPLLLYSRGGWCSCGGSGRGEPTFDAN